MKWEVNVAAAYLDKPRTSEIIEADSVYINACSTLMFMDKVKPSPPDPDAPPAPKKKPGWPKKAATVTVRAFNVGAWVDVKLIP